MKGVGGVLMDMLAYSYLMREEHNPENAEADAQDGDKNHDLRKLFPNPEDAKTKKKKVAKVSSKGTPEWLAVTVGVFFVGALFTIASYQVYKGNFYKQLSHAKIFEDQPLNKFPQHDQPLKDIYDEVQLPTDFSALSYTLYLEVNVKKKKFHGLINIEVMCKKKTSKVVLHSAYHNITIKRVKSADGMAIAIKDVKYNTNKEMLILDLSEDLIENKKYTLFFVFDAKLTYTYTNGIYLSKYRDGNGTEREMVSTDLEPTRARYLCPCYDEPALKAKWKIVILTADPGFTPVSNMPVNKINELTDNTKEYIFEESPLQSTYLVSVLVSEYEYHSTVLPESGIIVGIRTPIGRMNEGMQALEYAKVAVNYFSKEFGIPYMLPKLDMYPVTKFSAGADETWGNIVFGESELLVDPVTSSDGHRKRVAVVVSHEISHCWFGDLVSIKWWDDLWLKESFAQYLETLPVALINPSWDLAGSSYDAKVSALSFDFSQYTHPIFNPKQRDLVDSYDAITYEKGASIINQLADFLGHDILFNGLRSYLTKYAYSNAEMKQLWEVLSESSKTLNVVEFMDSWVTLPGFPVVSINAEKGVFTVTQERYKYKGLGDSNQATEQPLWHVPLKIMICSKEHITKLLVKGGKEVFDIDINCSSKLYKANFGATGYYHVNYDKENWNRLVELMNTNHEALPPLDRANVLYDAFSLTASNNYDDITLPLDFTRYMHKEDYPQAWSNGMSIMGKIRNVYYHTPLKDCVQAYTATKVVPVLNRLNKIKQHTHNQIVLIQKLLSYAVHYDIQPFKDIMENIFLKWAVSDGVETLSGNTRSIILCAGIRNGDKYSFNFVNKRRQEAESVIDKHIYTGALSCTRDISLLHQLLDEAVEKTDAVILQNVCYNREGRKFGWKALKENWKSFAVKYAVDSGRLHYLLESCIGGTKEEDLKDVEEFMDSTDLGRFKVYVLRSIEMLKHTIDFSGRHQGAVTKWFSNYFPQCLLK